jgi:hypothetical protein
VYTPSTTQCPDLGGIPDQMNKKTTMPRESWSFAQGLLPELSAVKKPTGCSLTRLPTPPRPRSGSGPDERSSWLRGEDSNKPWSLERTPGHCLLDVRNFQVDVPSSSTSRTRWRIKSANWLGRPGVPVTGVCELPFWSRHMSCLAPFVHMQWLVGSECVCVCVLSSGRTVRIPGSVPKTGSSSGGCEKQ